MRREILMLRNNFLKFDTVKELHHELTNIVYLGREYDVSWYCFCYKRVCCCFFKKKCTLCLFCSILFKHDLSDNMSAREFLQRNVDNEQKLRQFANLIWPYFKQMFFLKPESLDFFNQQYHWSCRNYREGTHSSMTLTEIIENDSYLIRLSKPEHFLNFTYGQYGTQKIFSDNFLFYSKIKNDFYKDKTDLIWEIFSSIL